MKEKYVLLIWEEIPESTKFFLIPEEIADEYKEHLEGAHNKFINSDDENDGMMFLSMAVCKPGESYGDDTPFKDNMGVFHAYEVDVAKPITGTNIKAVYLSGFVL